MVMLYAIALSVGALVIVIAPFFVFTPRPLKPIGTIHSAAELEAYLNTLTANETPPALDVVVMKNGSMVYSKAFGVSDRPSQKMAKSDDVYHYWSVTKLFTATAIMQLADDHKLALDDPVTKYLHEFRTSLASGISVDITIRQLLNHTSGMKNLGPTDLVGWIHHLGDPEVNQVTLVGERMQSYQALVSNPGTTGAYSNAGYIILGAIVEVASEQPYEEFVRNRILKPLSMKSSDFVYRKELLDHAASGSHPFFHFYTPLLFAIHHDWFTSWVSKITSQRMWLNPLNTDYTGPTGLLGTGEDLARFGQAFLDGCNGNDSRILRATTCAKMLDDGYGGNDGPDKDRMGLGWHWWDTVPISFKGHGGGGPGFGAQLAIFPAQKLVVVILANDTLIDRVGLTQLVATTFQ